jgi:hypothetical protein
MALLYLAWLQVLAPQQCALCVLSHIKQPDVLLAHQPQAGRRTLASSSVTHAATQQRQGKTRADGLADQQEEVKKLAAW